MSSSSRIAAKRFYATTIAILGQTASIIMSERSITIKVASGSRPEAALHTAEDADAFLPYPPLRWRE